MLRKLVASAFVVAGAVSVRPVEVRAHDPGGLSTAVKPDVHLVASQPFEFLAPAVGLNLGRSNVLNLAAGDFTVHAWVKFKALTSPDEWGSLVCYGPGCDMSIVDKIAKSDQDEPNSNGWRLLKQSDDHFWFCLGTAEETNGCWDGSPTTVISQTVAQPGLWYSIAATKTASRISIYVNGVLEGTTALGGFLDTNPVDLRVGANDPEGESAFLYGWVGDVTLFKRALNSGQVRALFETSKQKYR